MGSWAMVKGCWVAKREGLRLTRLTVGASNDLQMERNLTGGLPMMYQGLSKDLDPFWEHFSPAHETRLEGCNGAQESVGLGNRQWGKWLDAWDEHECKWDAHDDMIWNVWHEQNEKQKKKPNHWGNIISHSQKWQESELQIWKVTWGVLHAHTTPSVTVYTTGFRKKEKNLWDQGD